VLCQSSGDVRRHALALLLLAAVAPAAIDSTFSIDKAEHLVVSAGVSGLIYVGAARVLPHWPALAVAAGSTMAVALGKECWDATRYDSYWSWKDLAADATGVLLTAAIATAVKSWGKRHPSRVAVALRPSRWRPTAQPARLTTSHSGSTIGP
jgi:uncharacterized protein YfiM (DUF2279 family)